MRGQWLILAVLAAAVATSIALQVDPSRRTRLTSEEKTELVNKADEVRRLMCASHPVGHVDCD
jgi:hypothetical protein